MLNHSYSQDVELVHLFMYPKLADINMSQNQFEIGYVAVPTISYTDDLSLAFTSWQVRY